jgi:hypothetical protein
MSGISIHEKNDSMLLVNMEKEGIEVGSGSRSIFLRSKEERIWS